MEKYWPLAVAPVLICLCYMYIRDKYEKEPYRLLAVGLVFGAAITAPIVHVETLVMSWMPALDVQGEALYVSFLVASLVEEGFKLLVLCLLMWRERNFNERFDGIVYAVFISLGFACVENVLYVVNPSLGGLGTALSRAVYSVPAHGFFGVAMGYYIALWRFVPTGRVWHALGAFFVPWALHGAFDFILLAELPHFMFLFVPFVILLWWGGLRKMRRHLALSPFRNADKQGEESDREKFIDVKG